LHVYIYIIAPKPAFKPLVDHKEASINKNQTEIRISKDKDEKVDVGTLFFILQNLSGR